MYNPNIHKRRSIRLKDYDYSKEGMYYITICTKNRECILGNIRNVGAPAHRCPKNWTIWGMVQNIEGINLSAEGKIVEKYIDNINVVYENIKLEERVIMPNHLHFIINMTSGHLWAGAPTRDKPIRL
jgi:REP element-mobilizing transposase RayT